MINNVDVLNVDSAKALICRSQVKPGDMNKLLERFEIFRSEQAAELIRQNYLRRHVEETQSILVNVDDESLDRNKVLGICIEENAYCMVGNGGG